MLMDPGEKEPPIKKSNTVTMLKYIFNCGVSTVFIHFLLICALIRYVLTRRYKNQNSSSQQDSYCCLLLKKEANYRVREINRLDSQTEPFNIDHNLFMTRTFATKFQRP